MAFFLFLNVMILNFEFPLKSASVNFVSSKINSEANFQLIFGHRIYQLSINSIGGRLTIKQMAQVFNYIFDSILEEFAFIGNEIMKYKNRKWAKKQKTLMLKQIAVLFFSIVTATVIVSVLKPPKRAVPIKHISWDDLPNFLSGIFKVFSFFGSLDRFITNLQFRLGIIYDIIVFIPSKLFNLIRFIIISLCQLFSLVFTNIGGLFAYPALMFERAFSFFIHLPGISHLIAFFTYLIQDIVLLISAFFEILRKIGIELYKFDLAHYKFWDYVLLGPRIILLILSKIFEAFILPILKFFKLDILFGIIFSKLATFFNFFMPYILNISVTLRRFFDWIAIGLRKFSAHIHFRPIQSITVLFSGFFKFLGNLVMFPVYLFTNFLGAIYYFCTQFNHEFTKWWDSLCCCGENCNMCANFDTLNDKVSKIADDLEILIELNKDH